MIDVALLYVKDALNQYLVNRFGLDEDIVVLNNLTDPDGSVSQKNQNKIVITLINLDHETSQQYYGGSIRSNNKVGHINQDVHFNLDVLFAAHFDNYSESLKFLTATVSFFQANNTFNRKNSPTMSQDITALKFEIENASYEKTHNLWSALGVKYQPSIIYKIRHVTVQAGQINAVSSVVTGSGVEARP